jgi:hypothetical protein
MPEYAFNYEESQVFEVRFTADTKWDAINIMDMVQNGELDPMSWDDHSATCHDKRYELFVDKGSLSRTDGEDV